METATMGKGYTTGLIGRVAQLHAAYYSREWDFGLFFEAKVAREMAEFMERYDSERDGIWHVSDSRGLQGSITIDGVHGDGEGAHLRWFILSDGFRGKGQGGRLLAEAVKFCRRCDYAAIYLWTFAGLEPARHLYEKHGFVREEERPGSMWGTEVSEQRFVLKLY